ncbi:MAG: Holin toxin secretion/phage lysis [Firmicutes bacterium]|nr:Holin toxin secretion/phage lysis [Bacillota bacterium]
MEKLWDRLTEAWQIKIACGVVSNWLFGEYNAGMGALICLVALDWLTKWGVLSKEAGGFWTAWRTDAISSRGMRDGLRKIIWYMAALIAAYQLGQFSMLGLKIGHSSTEIVSAYLAIIESKSILENLRDMGMKGVEPLIALLGKKQRQITGGK